MMTRGVIEPLSVNDEPNVRKIAEEDQRPKLILLFRSRRVEAAPQGARTAAFEINSGGLVNAPYKT